LETYSAKFTKDIDVLWDTHDTDKNGYLDRKEAKTYLNEISKCIDKDRAENYDKEKFDQLFEKFDENGDNFLSKSEMSVLIKKVFKKPGPPNAFKGKPVVSYLEKS
jgi:Ca2+-binding EF-hand superfamily protein